VKKTDLSYTFPKELIALKPERPSRVLLNNPGVSPQEISMTQLLSLFQPGDLLVINETKVIPSRLKSTSGEEFLFIRALSDFDWEVLFPAKAFRVGQSFDFPEGLKVELSEKGLPQRVRTSKPMEFDYFQKHGLVNLPPYILSERGKEKYLSEDQDWYQTKWAKEIGSVAAPTASLHFSLDDLNTLEAKGVTVRPLTLHVGLGTFFPLRSEQLTEHKMHFETVSVPKDLILKAEQTRASGRRVWALGTTVVRALESVKGDLLERDEEGDFSGETNLFIYPPYEFQLVNGLLTNFHQPESTLLALVCAFYGQEKVMEAYSYAIKERFRLFSYGDLSVWIQ